MNLEKVTEALKAIKNGVWVSLHYKSDVPVKAAYKKQGISVVKVTKNVVRTGVGYENMAAVIEKKSAEDYVAPAPRENNKEWLIDDKLFYNTKTEKYYARFGFCNGHKAQSEYAAYKDGKEIEFNKDYAIDSYWNKSGDFVPTVFDLKIDNIISLG